MREQTCKTCRHWTAPRRDDWRGDRLCAPQDPDTYEPMARGFEVRICRMPTQTFCETPVEHNGFGLADGSQFMALLVTAEDFGCVRHESHAEPAGGTHAPPAEQAVAAFDRAVAAELPHVPYTHGEQFQTCEAFAAKLRAAMLSAKGGPHA